MSTPTALQKRRAALEAAVAAAIALLDAMDGDADLEPTLGAPEATLGVMRPGRLVRAMDQRRWAQGTDCGEREAVSEDEGAQCEDEGARSGDEEPWLGAPEGALGYGNLVCGGMDDLELDRSPVDPDDDPGEYVARCEVGLAR